MNIKNWCNDLKKMNKKFFFLKLNEKFIEKKIERQFNTELTNEQKERILHFFYYTYLRKKYSSFIKQIPINVDFNEKNTTKIIWWCWFQGEENAPLLCKKCLASLRKYLKEYEIKIVTEDNIFTYLDFPEYIIKKYNNGNISRTHFSDLVRSCLLYKYGGVWIDSTVLLTEDPSELFEYPLFYFNNVDRCDEAISGSSWLISAAKGHPVFLLLQTVLFNYWKNNDSLIHYYLFHMFLRIINEIYPYFYESMPSYSNIPPHILQKEMFNKYDETRFNQIKEISKIHKLTWKYDDTKNIIDDSYINVILNS